MTDEKTILKDLVNPKKDIIEIWRKPLFCTVQLKVQKSGQNPAKQCVLDLSQPLGTMIPILQKVFSKDIKLEEFSLFLLEKGRIERLNTNKSLLDCRFKGQEQLLMVPLSLQFRRKYADTTSHCQKEGVLEKMSVHGGSLTGKKTRHFVLTEGYLFYYKKKGMSCPSAFARNSHTFLFGLIIGQATPLRQAQWPWNIIRCERWSSRPNRATRFY
jgi:hypothetical protein